MPLRREVSPISMTPNSGLVLKGPLLVLAKAIMWLVIPTGNIGEQRTRNEKTGLTRTWDWLRGQDHFRVWP